MTPYHTRCTVSTTVLHQKTHSTQCKYNLPPLIPISFFMLFHNLLTLYFHAFMSVSNRPLHSIFIISPKYTPSYIPITYTWYNINTIQIANKILCISSQLRTYYPNVPDQSCLHIISYINFINYVMMIICTLVKIINIHTQTHFFQWDN